jgi:O-antigen/teichoic acid export membrane protein
MPFMPLNTTMRSRVIAFGKFFAGMGALYLTAQVVGFVSMLIKFRYLQAELMGVLGFFVALSNFPPAFYENFSRLLTRFLSTATPTRQAELIVVSFLSQTALLAAIAGLAGVSAWVFDEARFWQGQGIDPRLSVMMTVFVVLIVPLNMVSSLLGACLTAWQRYKVLQVIDIMIIFLNLVVTAVVVWLVDDRIFGLKIMTGSMILSAGTILLIRYLIFRRIATCLTEIRSLSPSRWPLMFRGVYQDHLKNYTLPLQLSGIFWYLTENLPVLVFGRMGLMSEAGVYNLVSRIFGVPRKFIPQLITMIFPRLIESKTRDKEVFSRKYVLLSWGHFGVHAALATLLFVAMPLIAILAKISPDKTLMLLFGAFSFNLVIHAMVTSNGNLILLSTDTRWVLLTSGLRALAVVLMNIILIPLWHGPGAALALVISTVFVLGMYILENRREGILSPSLNAKQFLAAVGVAGVWAAVAWWGGGF